MIEKLLGVFLGYWACKFMSGFDSFFQSTGPGAGAPSPGPTSNAPAASHVPEGARPAHMPDGAIPVVSPGGAPHPVATPAGLPPFPGPGWTFSKTNDAIVHRAWALLPTLALHQYTIEPSPTNPAKWLAYRKEKHAQGKTGVTVYTPRQSAPAQQSYPVTVVRS